MTRSTSNRPTVDAYGRRYAAQATSFGSDATADCSKDETLPSEPSDREFSFLKAPGLRLGLHRPRTTERAAWEKAKK
jgi:hypothetical protein